MLLRVSMIRELGLLDDGMRFICSDADYSFRARAAGWDCVVVPSAYVEHEPSGSSNVENLFLTQIKLEDQLYFSRKWVGSDIFKMLAFEGKK